MYYDEEIRYGCIILTKTRIIMATFKRDWNRDGFLVISDAKTLDRYEELEKQKHEVSDKEIFFASSDEQLQEGLKKSGLNYGTVDAEEREGGSL